MLCFTRSNTEDNAAVIAFISVCLSSRFSGDTKVKNQTPWAPTPRFMTGYPKMTCSVRLTLSGMNYTLGKATSFIFLLKWLIWVKEPQHLMATVTSVPQAAEISSWSHNFIVCFWLYGEWAIQEPWKIQPYPKGVGISGSGRQQFELSYTDGSLKEKS